MTDREIFKNNLDELMRITKTKQADIARYAEVSYKTVSAWVCGRAYPRVDAMEKLCEFFGIKQSALTEEGENPEENKLLLVFRSLPNEGKQKLLERADELLFMYGKRKKYAKAKETV